MSPGVQVSGGAPGVEGGRGVPVAGTWVGGVPGVACVPVAVGDAWIGVSSVRVADGVSDGPAVAGVEVWVLEAVTGTVLDAVGVFVGGVPVQVGVGDG